ncbi:cupin [Terrihabitans soli]|uniref:Cupin n=1 Tax=Terrihabitans soli TaxID=708113 RepID=A0A6S6QU06_9HYPH|nr:cupin domain-containing protein [Terrihabitans soli]BCJ90551.1 cupin [Terrihabitans soli]
MIGKLMCAAALIAMTASAASAHGEKKSNVRVVFDQELPNVPGKSMRGILVEYGPGESNPSHRHPNSAFIYATVLDGAIKSQVNGGPVITYRTGESWSERPGDHHQVSANASTTAPAKLLAVFVVDTAEKEILYPDPSVAGN